MSNAVIYARYSSDKQNEESIDAQVRACREYAAAHGLSVISLYADEGISGKGSKTAKRAQYQKMLRDAEKGHFDTVLIHKYDRVARSLGEHVNLQAKLQKSGVTLIATAQDFGTSKEAKLMTAITWALSEFYIDNLADETRKGLKETALHGLHTGGYPPFGYDVVDQRYIVNDLEAAYVRKIFDAALRREGYTAMIREMEERGIRGKRGKPIKYTQIYEMLRNEKYTGVLVYSPVEETRRGERRTKPNAIRIENAIPAIIDKAQFAEVQKIMNEKKHVGRKADYLCGGLVYCECGAKMHAHKSTKKGHEYFYYYCSGRCGAPMVSMEEVDSAAVRYLRDLLSEENQNKIAVALRKYQDSKEDRMEDFKAVLRKKISEKQAQYDNLMGNLSSGAMPAEIVADVTQRMTELKAEIKRLENTEPPEDFTVDHVHAWLDSLKDHPDREAVRLLIERIDVSRQKEKTVFNITSTLKTVLGNNGCGGRI